MEIISNHPANEKNPLNKYVQNMTQIEFGAMLHVKNVTVSHWERGHSFPGLKRCDEIRAICIKKISELEDKRKIDTDMEEL